MEPPRGFEPRTDGLRNHCSTAELRRLAALGYCTAPTLGAVLAGGDAGGFFRARLAHDELTLLGIDHDRVALPELAVENGHGERVLNSALDHSFQRPGAVGRVIALVGDQLDGRPRE